MRRRHNRVRLVSKQRKLREQGERIAKLIELSEGRQRQKPSLPPEAICAVMTVIAAGFFRDEDVLVRQDGQPDDEKIALLEIHGAKSRRTQVAGAAMGANDTAKLTWNYIGLRVLPASEDNRTATVQEEYLWERSNTMASLREAVDALKADGFKLIAYESAGPRVTEVTLRRPIAQARLLLEVTVRP